VSAASRRARAQAASGRRAGLVTRLLVTAVDFVVVTALLFGILFSISVAQYLMGGDVINLPNTGPISSSLAFLVVEFVYLAVAWRLTGRTFGKQVFGLRAIQADGAPLSRRRSIARAAWCTVIGIPSLLWAGVSSRNAAVHDIVLHTAVVYDWSERAAVALPVTVVTAVSAQVAPTVVAGAEIPPRDAVSVTAVRSQGSPAPGRTFP
jgi:uncharacterized RDD family membrane protein YckC